MAKSQLAIRHENFKTASRELAENHHGYELKVGMDIHLVHRIISKMIDQGFTDVEMHGIATFGASNSRGGFTPIMYSEPQM